MKKCLFAALFLVALFAPEAAVSHESNPLPIVPAAPDCSSMADPFHVGVSDPLYCARKWAGLAGGQCVAFIQRLYGSFYTDPGFRGVAGQIDPNTAMPAVGEAVLINEGVGHAALIYAMQGDILTLVESNEADDGIIQYGRTIRTGDPRIRGYFRFTNAPTTTPVF